MIQWAYCSWVEIRNFLSKEFKWKKKILTFGLIYECTVYTHAHTHTHTHTHIYIYIYIYMYAYIYLHLCILADAFIQSDLQCIQALHICQYVCSLGIEPTTFCAANAMLYHWATGTLNNTYVYIHFREGDAICRGVPNESEQLNPYTKGPSRSLLAKGTCDGHFTEVISVCDHVIFS